MYLLRTGRSHWMYFSLYTLYLYLYLQYYYKVPGVSQVRQS